MKYKEKYECGLECIQEILSGAGDSIKTSVLRKRLQPFFPELKESEDERIRKDCIKYLDWEYQHCSFNEDKMKIEKCITWLEKQGEQKSTDKTEPKFKVGDWVVFIASESIYQVEKIENYEYTLRHILGGSLRLSFSNEELIREWTIADAKDGDVLCYKDEISLYKHDIKNCAKQETSFGGFVYYCCYDGKRFISDSLYSLTEQDKTDIHPATKEQCDTLERAMTNAGYRWNKEKLKLEKI